MKAKVDKLLLLTDHTSTQLTDDDDGPDSSHRGSHDSEEDDGETSAKLTHAYGGASTSGDYHDSGGASGETTELGHDLGEVNDEISQSDPETHTESDHEGEETPKSRKRVRRPKRWKKNKRIRLRNTGKEYTSVPGKKVRNFS